MKKKILALCLVVALAATAIIGGTLAYFTDGDEATNTFTVGNVSIDLIESKLSRDGGENSPTDDAIKADAETYMDYLAEAGKNMVPGRTVAKCPYVINTGRNDAYIRIRILIPVNTYDIIQEVQWLDAAADEFGSIGLSMGKEVDGVVYDEYVLTRTEPLAPGAMTTFSAWNGIGIKAEADNEDIQTAIEAGAISVLEDGTLTFNVLVQADAIQAEGFESAEAAWAAFSE